MSILKWLRECFRFPKERAVREAFKDFKEILDNEELIFTLTGLTPPTLQRLITTYKENKNGIQNTTDGKVLFNAANDGCTTSISALSYKDGTSYLVTVSFEDDRKFTCMYDDVDYAMKAFLDSYDEL